MKNTTKYNESERHRGSTENTHTIKDDLKEKAFDKHGKLKELYKDVTFSRMVWVFFIGCIIGYIVEMLFCYATLGFFESRQGMVYGPFSQIYGFGAVIMVLLLTPFARKGAGWLFVGGALIGGVFEVVCSFIQESIFGSVSWDYSSRALSMFGGRTHVIFMVFWGVLATVYMKFIYPFMADLIDKIPKKIKSVLTIFIVVFLAFNMLVSSMAVLRWSDRQQDIAPNNTVEIWLDKEFPDERLNEIYPNMRFSLGS